MNKDDKKTEEEVQDYVAKHYEEKRYAKDYSLKYQDWWSKKTINIVKPNGKILDIGCGTGHFASRFLKNYDVTGIDISGEMVKYAKKRMERVVQGDAQNLPFENNAFDIVFARGLLHHLPNPEKAIKEIQRVLKKHGRVIFSEPVGCFLNSLPREIMYKKSKHFSEEHKSFKKEELIRLVNSELKIKKKYYFGYIAYALLGFPDILDIYKYVPFKFFFTPFLIKLDEIIAKIPLVKKQAWCLIVLAEKE